MGYAFRSSADRHADLDLEDILRAARQSARPGTPLTGVRARARGAKARYGEAGVIAAILGIQGCLPVAGDGPAMSAPEPEPAPPPSPAPAPAGGSGQAPSAEAFAVAENAASEIALAELLKAQPDAHRIVDILGAENGVAALSGSVVQFTPADGYTGPARIEFSYLDEAGRTHTGAFDILVDDDACHCGHDDGHTDDGHTDDGHTDDGQTDDGHSDDGQTDDGHPDDGQTDDGRPDDGQTDDGRPDDGQTDDGSPDDGQTNDGRPDDGQTDDGHTDDGQTDDGAGHAEDDATSHIHDPAMQAEHDALLNLVPVSDATHVAVKDGSWFDPATWASGEVPGDGAKVVIPRGVAVAYDGESDASIFTVRVDGALDFATDRDTLLEVDTLVVTETGRLVIGAADDPVAPGVEAVIRIAANGPIDVAWDPLLLSRGIISQGAVEIHGAEKETFIKVAADPMKGDTSLLLEAPPEGWRIGDSIVLTGTHLGTKGSAQHGEARVGATTEDEVLTITRIEGDRVYFDRPLEFDHEGPRADLKAYVADFTRNVRIETEGGEATPVHQRGHVMFMHSDDVDVRYAEFHELGRTDKSERAFDAGAVDDITPDANVKGRYAVHIHRAGVGDQDHPAMLVGNAVWGSPGWGFVHHDSNAILADNAAYDVFGAAFVAEAGNETGRWVDNIAIKSLGVETSPKEGGDVIAFDTARGGVGFWFEGRLVEAVGNVAAGMPGGHGFVYMSRIPSDREIRIDPDVVPQGEKLRYLDSNHINEPNIGIFSGNEAIAAYQGLEVIKNGPKQNNDVRTVLDDFSAWEVARGAILQYTGHYTLRNFDLVATDAPHVDPIKLIGLWYQTNVFDVVVWNTDISGFEHGVLLRHESLFNGVDNFRYVFVDVDITGASQDYSGLLPQDRILSYDDIVHRDVTYISSLDAIVDGPNKPSDPPIVLAGVKTDSLGVTETSTDWDPFTISYWSIRGAVEQNGYWQTADGRLVTQIEEYVSDRLTGTLEKFAIWVEVPSGLDLVPGVRYEGVRVAPEFHGLYDPDNLAPVAGEDAAEVEAGHSIVIDVLANDHDPEGADVDLDAVWSQHGRIVQNDDGTVTYFADPGFSGVDTFFYWASDDQGNFTKAQVTVTVDA